MEEFKTSVQSILSLAEKNFKRVFWNAELGFLFNIVHENESLADEIESEAAVTAAAMLGESMFSLDELRSIWNVTKTKLLVHRKLIRYGEETFPFGILARNEDQRIFYDDTQYHADTIWPKSTPYLIKLLRMLKEKETIRQILINTLDHQMSEAAIFYSQELFSRPHGNNPHPDNETSYNPVPVKNPIQFWSQWCDAFLDFCIMKD
jgi:glycogen debranching enzyme